MTFEQIRQKTQELHKKTRWELMKSASALPIIIVMLVLSLPFHDGIVQTAFGLALVWALVGQYFLHRGTRSAAAPGDAAFDSGMELYRREVERRRSLSGSFLQWQFGPALWALATLIVGAIRAGILNRDTLPKATPFLTVLIIWLIAVFIIRIRQQRELQQEIEELRAIERMNDGERKGN